MKFRFIESHQRQFSVRRMCRVLEVSSSGFYCLVEADCQPSESGTMKCCCGGFVTSFSTVASAKAVHGSTRSFGQRVGESAASGLRV